MSDPTTAPDVPTLTDIRAQEVKTPGQLTINDPADINRLVIVPDALSVWSSQNASRIVRRMQEIALWGDLLPHQRNIKKSVGGIIFGFPHLRNDEAFRNMPFNDNVAALKFVLQTMQMNMRAWQHVIDKTSLMPGFDMMAALGLDARVDFVFRSENAISPRIAPDSFTYALNLVAWEQYGIHFYDNHGVYQTPESGLAQHYASLRGDGSKDIHEVVIVNPPNVNEDLQVRLFKIVAP